MDYIINLFKLDCLLYKTLICWQIFSPVRALIRLFAYYRKMLVKLALHILLVFVLENELSSKKIEAIFKFFFHDISFSRTKSNRTYRPDL